MITAYLVTLHVLSAFGIVGLVDITFLHGSLGVYIAGQFPWAK